MQRDGGRPGCQAEWYSIVEGEHALWADVSEPYKHTIRAFLSHFNSQVLNRVSHPSSTFRFSNGSVGNFFFAGARIFFGSLDAAIFLYSRVSRIPDQSRVLPAISTNHHLNLSAELEDGTMLHGQNAISHPMDPNAQTVVDKNHQTSMGSPVRRILYLSSGGAHREHEVRAPTHCSPLLPTAANAFDERLVRLVSPPCARCPDASTQPCHQMVIVPFPHQTPPVW